MSSTILELAISLMLFYLLVSGLCSAIQELIANFFRWRAKQLEEALAKLLRDPAMADKIYAHPLVAGLMSPAVRESKSHRPSYLTNDTFARVLLDLHQNKQLSEKAAEVVQKLVQNVENDFAKQRAAVETWFDDSMGRVSGWYKRKAHAWLWAIAMVLCLVVNADSLRLAKVFWNDEALRQSMVTAATTYVKEHDQTNKDQPSGEQAFKNVKDAAAKLDETTIPLGWCDGNCWPLGGKEKDANDPRHWPGGWQGLCKLLLVLPGVLITALAVSQGSPFWFDLLSKAANLRLAGQKPEKK